MAAPAWIVKIEKLHNAEALEKYEGVLARMAGREARRKEVGLEGVYGPMLARVNQPGEKTTCDGLLSIDEDDLEVKWVFHGCAAADEEKLISGTVHSLLPTHSSWHTTPPPHSGCTVH